MKKYMNKSIALLMIAALVIGIICLIYSGTDIASATGYTQEYTDLTDEQLDELSVRTTKSNAAPQITVFTHGYGGNAGHWSNDLSVGGKGKFAYESDSMIEQLRESIESKDKQVTMFAVRVGEYNVNKQKATLEASQSEILNTALTDNVGAKQLRCIYDDDKYITDKQVFLYKNDSQDYHVEEDETSETHLTSNDVTKHIILVFNGEESERSNDYVYAQFEYILDAISYQYCQLTGILPTYNLIGHSRGGIMNMQYALAHPYNVASLYSMGTPYNGSAFGSTGDLFLKIAGMVESNKYYSDGTVDYPPGVLDILNTELNESYKSFWNTYYNKWYSHIEFRPIGSYITGGFLLQTLADFLTEDGSVSESVVRGVAGLVETAIDAAEIVFIFKHVAVSVLSTVIDQVVDLIIDAIPNAPSWVELIRNLSIGSVGYDHLGMSMHGAIVYEDDLFIDLNSQVAEGYNGLQVKVRLMDSNDQISGKKSVADVGIGHNLETHQKDIVNYVVASVLEDIDLSTNDIFTVRYQGINLNECVITRVKAGQATVLNIPEQINGKTVVGIDSLSEGVKIGKDSFSTENINLRTVNIPSTVRYIGKAAFYGMQNLQTIQLSSNSQLESIEAYAFMNSGLTGTVALPNNVNSVGRFAFAYCTGITGFAKNNSQIYESDGVLYSTYNNNVELVQYPAGKTSTTFSIPSNVGVIGAGAFAGNERITTVNLGKNLHRIGYGAFVDCTNLETIQNGDNVGFVETGAFEGTEWIEKEVSVLTVGSVLVKYNGNASDYVLPNQYTAISSMAFEGSNVENLIITNTRQLVSVCDFAVAENINVKVPNAMLADYLNNTQWQNLHVDISAMMSFVQFNSNGGTAIEPITINYGDYPDLDVPTKNGYFFIGWSYNGVLLTNEEGYTFDMWKYYDDVILTAEWRPESYTITLTLENNDKLWLEIENGKIDLSDILTTVSYGEKIGDLFEERVLDILKNDRNYNVPGKIITGFTVNGEFINWDNYDFLPDLGEEKDIDIELVYQSEVYNITFVTNSSKGTYTIPITYGEIIDYPNIEDEAGFAGWYYDAQFNVLCSLARMPDLTPNSEGSGSMFIYAKWNELYEITFDSNGGTSCASIKAYKGDVIILPTSTRTGYDGTWGDYDFGDSFTVTEDMTLVADWTGKYYTITFNNNGGSGGTTSASVQYKGSMPDITFPMRAGYKLDYFYDSNNNQYYIGGKYDLRAYELAQNLYLTAHWSEAFLQIKNLGWDSGKDGWKIKVTNTSSTTVTVDYNLFMCFLGDAQKWTGLKDLDDFTLAPGASAEKIVKENWFATSVTFSYVAGDYRYITYADGLDKNGGISVKKNRITK